MHDIEKYEAEMREMLRQYREKGEADVAAGLAQPGFVKAQIGYEEARVQFALVAPRLANDGISDVDIVAGAGVAIGMMYGALLGSVLDSPDLRAVLDEWIATATRDAVAGFVDPAEGLPMSFVVVSSVPNSEEPN